MTALSPEILAKAANLWLDAIQTTKKLKSEKIDEYYSKICKEAVHTFNLLPKPRSTKEKDSTKRGSKRKIEEIVEKQPPTPKPPTPKPQMDPVVESQLAVQNLLPMNIEYEDNTVIEVDFNYSFLDDMEQMNNQEFSTKLSNLEETINQVASNLEESIVSKSIASNQEESIVIEKELSKEESSKEESISFNQEKSIVSNQEKVSIVSNQEESKLSNQEESKLSNQEEVSSQEESIMSKEESIVPEIPKRVQAAPRKQMTKEMEYSSGSDSSDSDDESGSEESEDEQRESLIITSRVDSEVEEDVIDIPVTTESVRKRQSIDSKVDKLDHTNATTMEVSEFNIYATGSANTSNVNVNTVNTSNVSVNTSNVSAGRLREKILMDVGDDFEKFVDETIETELEDSNELCLDEIEPRKSTRGKTVFSCVDASELDFSCLEMKYEGVSNLNVDKKTPIFQEYLLPARRQLQNAADLTFDNDVYVSINKVLGESVLVSDYLNLFKKYKTGEVINYSELKTVNSSSDPLFLKKYRLVKGYIPIEFIDVAKIFYNILKHTRKASIPVSKTETIKPQYKNYACLYGGELELLCFNYHSIYNTDLIMWDSKTNIPVVKRHFKILYMALKTEYDNTQSSSTKQALKKFIDSMVVHLGLNVNNDNIKRSHLLWFKQNIGTAINMLTFKNLKEDELKILNYITNTRFTSSVVAKTKITVPTIKTVQNLTKLIQYENMLQKLFGLDFSFVPFKKITRDSIKFNTQEIKVFFPQLTNINDVNSIYDSFNVCVFALIQHFTLFLRNNNFVDISSEVGQAFIKYLADLYKVQIDPNDFINQEDSSLTAKCRYYVNYMAFFLLDSFNIYNLANLDLQLFAELCVLKTGKVIAEILRAYIKIFEIRYQSSIMLSADLDKCTDLTNSSFLLYKKRTAFNPEVMNNIFHEISVNTFQNTSTLMYYLPQKLVFVHTGICKNKENKNYDGETNPCACLRYFDYDSDNAKDKNYEAKIEVDEDEEEEEEEEKEEEEIDWCYDLPSIENTPFAEILNREIVKLKLDQTTFTYKSNSNDFKFQLLKKPTKCTSCNVINVSKGLEIMCSEITYKSKCIKINFVYAICQVCIQAVRPYFIMNILDLEILIDKNYHNRSPHKKILIDGQPKAIKYSPTYDYLTNGIFSYSELVAFCQKENVEIKNNTKYTITAVKIDPKKIDKKIKIVTDWLDAQVGQKALRVKRKRTKELELSFTKRTKKIKLHS